MTSPPNKGKGAGIALIRASLSYDGDDCILWPLFLNPENGYGNLAVDGKSYNAHSYMCELAHGPKPTPQHHAAHSCHVRHCITPRHLSWKTPSQNMLDKRQSGTWVSSRYGNKGKLTPDEVQRIRELKDQHTQAELGRMFGVTEASIRNIHKGRTHKGRISPEHRRELALRAQAAGVAKRRANPCKHVPKHGMGRVVFCVRCGQRMAPQKQSWEPR
jgi:hypothetical protein